MTALDLKYYIFDWDDNILFMPTQIHMQRDGKPVNFTTKQFAELRDDTSYEPLDGSWDKAFKEFRDGTGDFVGDSRKAIAEKGFAPSFQAFKTALREARLFCIVTARGHSAETIRQGVEAFIGEIFADEERKEMQENIQRFHELAGVVVRDDQALLSYLDLNGYVGVSSPGFLKIFENQAPYGIHREASPKSGKTSEGDSGSSSGASTSPEYAKTFAVRRFVVNTLALAEALPAGTRRVAFGFSDDDKRNIETMQEFVDGELVNDYPNVEFFVYNTSGSKAKVEHL